MHYLSGSLHRRIGLTFKQACFAGGNLLLGGKFLDNQAIYDLGIAVTDSCHWFYNTTKAGLGPVCKFSKVTIVLQFYFPFFSPSH